MAGFRPVQLFSLAIPANGEPIEGLVDGEFPATFRITMAAIDPTAPAETLTQVNGKPNFVGSTLKIIRVPEDDESDNDDDDVDDSFDMAKLLDTDESDEDEEEDSDDEEVNGGPSDPMKSPKAKRKAALREAIANAMDEEDEDMDIDLEEKLSAKQKGKAKALDTANIDEDDEDSDMSIEGAEEIVLCTLDPSRQYQQPLDITVGEHETVFFRSTGTHTIHLTGNVLIPENLAQRQDLYDSDSEDDDEDGDYDLSPGEDELDEYDDEDESDALDDMKDPRVVEVDSDDDDEAADLPPKLIKAMQPVVAKGKNKRPADDSSDADIVNGKPAINGLADKTLKSVAAGSSEPEQEDKPMSKTQLKKMRKKMKDNAGNAVETTTITTVDSTDPQTVKAVATSTDTTPSKSDKKVQFAKTLVQGPSGSSQLNDDSSGPKTEKKISEAPKTNGNAAPASKPGKGPRVVQGVTVDDKKLGSGPAAKKGDKISMRYIGKLDSDKRVFDSNKKGPPFRFTLGSGEVIKGWDVGLAGITVGGERRITIPPHLAYGSKGVDGIPGNSTLVFDVKCLEIK